MDDHDFVSSASKQLEPLITGLIAELGAADNAYPMAFFTEILVSLRSVTDEEGLMQLFFRLSSTAFQGFVFSPTEAEQVDKLLENCEQIALTLSVNGTVQ